MDFRCLKNTVFLILPITLLVCFSCGSQNKEPNEILESSSEFTETTPSLKLAIDRLDIFLPMLKDQKVGVVANQTSVSFGEGGTTTHLVDLLLEHQINVVAAYAPEHGFRGTADAGEVIKDGVDVKTGLPIVSLYGNNKKPTAAQLKGIDILLFDIQDVGARFYTYISTLHYVMEACAEEGIEVMVLDRPNPNGHYIDGPILEPEYQSFVGMHPIPVVHGMTIGEYAQMINGEKWLKNGVTCSLKVITMENYEHDMTYSLPIKPSPNLPNDQAINLYPSLCFFESTPLSAGRGTEMQFQIFGDPKLPKEKYPFTFTPMPNEGSKSPKHNGVTCFGMDLRKYEKLNELHLEWLIQAYKDYPDKTKFFSSFFKKLSGTAKLQEQIEAGMSEAAIKASWQPGLERFKEVRKKYLLYK